MVFIDVPKHRLYFCVMYCVWLVVKPMFDVWHAQEKFEAENIAQNTCKDMESKGQFKTMNIASMEECNEVVKNRFNQILIFIVIFIAVIHVHFALVAYTHWKNSTGRNFSQMGEEDAIH